jgi:hypothetical protein
VAVVVVVVAALRWAALNALRLRGATSVVVDGERTAVAGEAVISAREAEEWVWSEAGNICERTTGEAEELYGKRV